jgi:ABC-type antimicrobial peptide transport system permease subunit
LFLLGRRNDGVSLDEARAELDFTAAQIDSQEPGRSTALRVERARPLTLPPFVRGAAMGAGVVVMVAFGLILLIACANVANLLLARGTTKGKEIAVRLSLGASRARVVRELLVESALLSIVGGRARLRAGASGRSRRCSPSRCRRSCPPGCRCSRST